LVGLFFQRAAVALDRGDAELPQRVRGAALRMPMDWGLARDYAAKDDLPGHARHRAKATRDRRSSCARRCCLSPA
jgi:hypothetical protein